MDVEGGNAEATLEGKWFYRELSASVLSSFLRNRSQASSSLHRAQIQAIKTSLSWIVVVR